ncbi:MAG: glycoside hydrolase family 3 N-terminal domain-containing protein, partial [Terracoccus sp.]
AGMRAGGIASTVKHFPGLGRIRGNTDLTATGITDDTTTTTPATSTPPTGGTGSCAPAVVAAMTPAEQAGQLLMVGLDANARRSSLDDLVAERHLGGVILLGGWGEGVAAVRATTDHLESLASEDDTAGLGLLLAADQEGGAVQQLKGAGFSRIPSARTQGRLTPAALTRSATTWAKQLGAAGINVNLAPVADTVPTSIGRANAPIGKFDRQYSSDPARVATMSAAFAAGMRAGGIASTVKHFPGLGRIRGNTDLTATGITDDTTTTTDPFLTPFQRGVDDGTDLVMVGSAIYPKLDPGTNAVFSRTIVTGLLRESMGYDGVVITDDVGAARAVAAVPVADRATRFIEAGGDVVLTARPGDVPTMHRALTRAAAADPAFASLLTASATRVVDLKLRMELARCS